MQLLLATTNPHKVDELRPLLEGVTVDGAPLSIRTLADLAPQPEPEETGATFWENARIKAFAYAQPDTLTIAEDSGLEVIALNGDPGVRSARYLGADASYPQRFADLQRRLDASPYRSRDARYVAALAVVRGREVLFETVCTVDGLLAPAPDGNGGFGYDPIFFYPPYNKTLASCTPAQKSAISHRGRAFRELAAWLRRHDT